MSRNIATEFAHQPARLWRALPGRDAIPAAGAALPGGRLPPGLTLAGGYDCFPDRRRPPGGFTPRRPGQVDCVALHPWFYCRNHSPTPLRATVSGGDAAGLAEGLPDYPLSHAVKSLTARDRR
ncbi:hypothetical protein G7K71_18345 [Desulfofundulus sp. TPOSR]|uniref:hypothetical protein n=1 Tax=Desulfofundulus sp. TPOSR TaxID=2714340 RepID=UPI001407B62E|nr:hypothetical protein [Desulfofundulus sp. TPOSR]NHM28884.1 hypothetical protein [Desulfofundulus sp. TPOSR]